MSYDLMVFEKTKAPTTKKEFIAWYEKQTEWGEEHDYETISVSSPALQNWFMEMKEKFPPMNGEYAPNLDPLDEDEAEDLERHTVDYCIGYDVIYRKYLIMGNGTRAFAVAAEQPEKDNPLRTAEMTLEDDYGMIDGVINNGRRGEELEKAQGYAERTTPEKPSIRKRLEDAKRECAEHKPQEGKKPSRDVPEHDCL